LSRLNNVTGRQAMRVAERRGWSLRRTAGDHFIYSHPRLLRNLSIPDHRELDPGTLRALIRNMEMTVDEFLGELGRR
jgi:predicted RNA binding protein YcfA (HicA-like mRNA interferase family)